MPRAPRTWHEAMPEEPAPITQTLSPFSNAATLGNLSIRGGTGWLASPAAQAALPTLGRMPAQHRRGEVAALAAAIVLLVIALGNHVLQSDAKAPAVSTAHLPRAKAGLDTAQAPGLPPLPPDFPDIRYQRLRPGPTGLFSVSPGQSKRSAAFVIVLNEDGQPVWWQRPSTIAYGAQVLRNGTVTWSRGFGDGYGIDPHSAAEVHTLGGRLVGLVRTPGEVTDVHEFQATPDGHTYLESYVPHRGADLRRWGGPRNAQVVLPRIVELDPSGKVVWRWSSLGRIRLSEASRWWNNSILQNPKRVHGRPTFDAVHINAIEPWGKQVVISTRHTDAIFGINRRSGRIAWKLGGTHRPHSLRVIGDPHGRIPFGGQHDVRMHGKVLSVFDNGTHRGLAPRAAFFRIDTKARTAT